MMENLLAAIPWLKPVAILAGVVVVTGILWRPIRGMCRLGKKIGEFLDDWRGEKARPGVDARPGVMQRIQSLHAELHPNHGSSLRDAVDRTETGLTEMRGELAAVRVDIARVEGAQQSWQERSYTYLRTVRASGIDLPKAPGEEER